MASKRSCKDCDETSHRPATYPGPRCATHHREFKKKQKEAAHERSVTTTYGLEAGEYARLYEAQGGRCAICQRARGKTRKLAVDHDHKTGKVRGLLCSPCNQYLGYVRDDDLAYTRGVLYLTGGI